MTMPTPASVPPPGYPPPLRERGNGCLWGCVILALILITPPILLGGYGAWILSDGYRHNPVLRLVGELVRSDGMAQQALGYGATITGVEGNAFSWVPGRIYGDYHVTLEGPKGEGHLIVRSHRSSLGPPSLDSAILTGPDGRRYDLLKHQQLPDDGTMRPDTSI
jgi:hypothetical protein